MYIYTGRYVPTYTSYRSVIMTTSARSTDFRFRDAVRNYCMFAWVRSRVVGICMVIEKFEEKRDKYAHAIVIGLKTTRDTVGIPTTIR